MIQLKTCYLFLLMLCAISITSCSKSDENATLSDPPEQGGGAENPDLTGDFIKLLCDGSRFINREQKEFTTSVIGKYSAITTQREYLFQKDGTGTITTYIADKTPRGFTQTEKACSWSVTLKSAVSLSITITGGETFVLEDVKIANNQLTSKSETLLKSQTVEGVINKEDILSYKIQTVSTKSFNEFGRIVLLCPPSILTVKTKTGEASFITHEYGTLSVQVGVPCFSKDGGPITYYESTVYAVVDTKQPFKYSFFHLDVSKDKKTFVSDGKMYFYLGSFSKETSSFSLIQSGKEYTVNN